MARQSQYEKRRLPLLQALAADPHGRPATVRALAASIGAGIGTTHDYLKRLRTEGLVEWEADKVRTLSLTDAAHDVLRESNPAPIAAAQQAPAPESAPVVKATVPAVHATRDDLTRPFTVERDLDEFADVGF